MVQELGKIGSVTLCCPATAHFLRGGGALYQDLCACQAPKFEVNPSTWAASRTVDVSRFRVGRRAATAGGGRAVAARPPPPRGGRRLPNSCAPPNCTNRFLNLARLLLVGGQRGQTTHAQQHLPAYLIISATRTTHTSVLRQKRGGVVSHITRCLSVPLSARA